MRYYSLHFATICQDNLKIRSCFVRNYYLRICSHNQKDLCEQLEILIDDFLWKLGRKNDLMILNEYAEEERPTLQINTLVHPSN